MKRSAATFLWGPRQTGKTTLLGQQLPDARFYDLLDTGLLAELTVRPRSPQGEVLAKAPHTFVIDEVQCVPAPIDEVHWLLEHTSTRFVLCGSSARSLRRRSRNLLGGRAIEQHLMPLTSHGSRRPARSLHGCAPRDLRQAGPARRPVTAAGSP